MSENRPIETDDRQRYWRRRANRRVRKVRRLRTSLRWIALVGFNGLTAIVLLTAGFTIVKRVTTSDEFALERVELRGVHRADESSIRSRLQPFVDDNLFALELWRVEAAVNRHPWVADLRVKRLLPDGLRVTVHERRPVSRAMLNGVTHLIDSTGYVVGPTRSERYTHLPVLVGLQDLEREVLIERLARGARLVQALTDESPQFAAAITWIDVGDPDRIDITTSPGEPKLLLDPDHIERNVETYAALRDQIERRVGQLEYVDLRWDRRITVMPKSNESSMGG